MAEKMDKVSFKNENNSFSNVIPSLQLAWDSTSLGELKVCPRKYYYRIICGYVGRDVSWHLIFGLVYHAAIERYDHARAHGKTFEEALNIAVQYALNETWDHKLNRPLESDIAEKDRFTLVRTIVWYLDQFENDTAQTIILDTGKPAVEMSFRFETGLMTRFTNEPILVSGHLDRLANVSIANYIMDKKTTKYQLDDKYFAGFEVDNQMGLYNFAGMMILNKPIDGIIIDAAQVLVNGTRFRRKILSYTSMSADEWLKDFQMWTTMAEIYAKQNYWPKNDKNCMQYGKLCPYHDVCKTAPSLRENKLKVNYDVRYWDPLAVRGEI